MQRKLLVTFVCVVLDLWLIIAYLFILLTRTQIDYMFWFLFCYIKQTPFSIYQDPLQEKSVNVTTRKKTVFFPSKNV